MTMTLHPVRAVVLTATTTCAAWWLAGQGASQAALPATLESLCTAAVAMGGAAASLTVAVLTLAALVEALLGWRPRAASALPAPLRRFLTATVTGAVIVGAALPAAADEVYPGWAPTEPVASGSPTPGAASPSPSPVAVEPVGTGVAATVEPATPHSPRDHAPSTHAPSSQAPSNDAPVATSTHVVERGDSLWRIAEQRLGSDATAAQVARAWPIIYQANRATIGGDPGLILPGQVLTIPLEVTA